MDRNLFLVLFLESMLIQGVKAFAVAEFVPTYFTVRRRLIIANPTQSVYLPATPVFFS
jgi:hypothetical protein